MFALRPSRTSTFAPRKTSQLTQNNHIDDPAIQGSHRRVELLCVDDPISCLETGVTRLARPGLAALSHLRRPTFSPLFCPAPLRRCLNLLSSHLYARTRIYSLWNDSIHLPEDYTLYLTAGFSPLRIVEDHFGRTSAADLFFSP